MIFFIMNITVCFVLSILRRAYLDRFSHLSIQESRYWLSVQFEPPFSSQLLLDIIS